MFHWKCFRNRRSLFLSIFRGSRHPGRLQHRPAAGPAAEDEPESDAARANLQLADRPAQAPVSNGCLGGPTTELAEPVSGRNSPAPVPERVNNFRVFSGSAAAVVDAADGPAVDVCVEVGFRRVPGPARDVPRPEPSHHRDVGRCALGCRISGNPELLV